MLRPKNLPARDPLEGLKRGLRQWQRAPGCLAGIAMRKMPSFLEQTYIEVWGTWIGIGVTGEPAEAGERMARGPEYRMLSIS
jgi:hypothetical protein